jgi:carbonic anhydrase
MSDARTGTTRAPMLAWERLRQGNQRFLSGQPRHPGQDGAKRAELSTRQTRAP